MTTRILPRRAVVLPGGSPPSFRLTSADRVHFDVELATDPVLFNGALRTRRSPANFYTSAVEPRQPTYRRGIGDWTLDPAAWARLARADFLYYRAASFNGERGAPVSVELTIADADASSAPFIRVSTSVAGLPTMRVNLSGKLPWLRLDGNRIVDDSSGAVVVLRGVNRSGMQYEAPGGLDPTGVVRATSREVAGITQAEISEIVRVWGANAIRLPIDQHWALTDGTYRKDLDRIVSWAAAEGAYTILCLHWLDTSRTFGHDAGGEVNHLAPMPEENSVRMWSALASWYARQPAVLFDLYNEPHAALPDDETFLFERPRATAEWIRMWHEWVRRLEDAVHRVHPRAIVLVSGWDWGLDLRSFPVQAGGSPLPNTVYSTHVYRGRTGGGAVDFDTYFGFAGLRTEQPVVVGEWGGADGDVPWATTLEAYMRDKHRYRTGTWQGLAGWTAWAWGDAPDLVERRLRSKGAARWRDYRLDARGHRVATRFGALVERALRSGPFADAAAGTVDRYGGYDLQHGDTDATATYEGFPRSADAGEPLPGHGSTGYVMLLQQDLASLGFPVVWRAGRQLLPSSRVRRPRVPGGHQARADCPGG